MKRKVLSAFMAAVMLVSLTACGQGSSDSVSSSAASGTSDGFQKPDSANPDKWKFDELATVSYCKVLNTDEANNLPADQQSGNNDFFNYVKNTYNIELQESWTAPLSDYSTQLALHVASGDLPDLIFVNTYEMYRQLIDNELVMPISDAYEKQCSDLMLAYDKSANGAYLKTVTIDDELWAIPAGKFTGAYDLLWLRNDWLQKLNLEVPSTIEELETVLRAFTNDDPDGNGVNDTFGLAVEAKTPTKTNTMFTLAPIFNSYGAYPTFWLQGEDGSVYNGSTQPEMKDALTTLQKWYAEGLIDKEFISRTGDMQTQGTVTSGQAGAFFGPWWSIPRDNALVETDWIALSGPVGSDGIFNYMQEDTFSDCFMINAKCQNPEAAVATIGICLDAARNVNQEAYDILEEARKPSGAARNLTPLGVYTADYADILKKLSDACIENAEKGSYTDYDGITDYDRSEIENARLWADGTQRDANTFWTYYGRVIGCKALETDNVNAVSACWYWDTESSPSINTSLDKLYDEMILQVITGQKDVSYFDEFVTEYNSLGGDTIASEIQEALK